MISSDEIKNRLWSGANELRGSMDASRYKDYMLGLMFYKFLSDKTLQSYAKVSSSKAVGNDLYLEYKEKVNAYQKGDLPIKDNPVIKFIGKYQGFSCP
ncbi:MAG: type I restriction-modification system subunit M N-terminal domain-containing protein [Succinivibrionaceae bacterium]|nr:type I restriction-modification system subunit M N-terminal domain-containing protein [Succinivibrionaceae bacterium]